MVIKDYFTLCKPKVVALMLITSLAGMHLASPEANNWQPLLFGIAGIALAASSAAVVNHLIDKKIDSIMLRTKSRPIASGRISSSTAILFAAVLGITGILILYFLVNPITAWLTLSSQIGYACIYTVILKRATPQNIVIGGLAGAMPPLLGWAAVTNNISPYALLLVLIIFTWTPPHFWALAIYRKNEYKNVNIPMLPVTHGVKFTKISILLYTILLLLVSIMPYLVRMSGIIYLSFAVILGLQFLYYTIKLYFSEKNSDALITFNYSIVYLTFLFIGLVLDHYFKFWSF